MRDVESGRRDLGLELKAVFDLAGRFLAYRDQMVGAGDFEKLVNTEKKHLYFGLNLKTPQGSQADDDLYGTLMPLAYFRTKREALGVLTAELDKLTSQPGVAEETKISFYRTAAGFLAQVPSEVVWLRQMRKEETDLLQDMFNNVFRQTLSMAEDLGDYAYMAQHPLRQSAVPQAPRRLYG